MPQLDIENMSLAEMTARWPGVLRVFLEWHLHCIGCPIARFHHLDDSAREHGYALDDLEAAVLASIEKRPAAGSIAGRPKRRRS